MELIILLLEYVDIIIFHPDHFVIIIYS